MIVCGWQEAAEVVATGRWSVRAHHFIHTVGLSYLTFHSLRHKQVLWTARLHAYGHEILGDIVTDDTLDFNTMLCQQRNAITGNRYVVFQRGINVMNLSFVDCPCKHIETINIHDQSATTLSSSRLEDKCGLALKNSSWLLDHSHRSPSSWRTPMP